MNACTPPTISGYAPSCTTSVASSSISALSNPSEVTKFQSIVNIGSVMRVEPALARMRSFAASAFATSAAQIKNTHEQYSALRLPYATTKIPSQSTKRLSPFRRSARHEGSSAIASSSTSSSMRAANCSLR